MERGELGIGIMSRGEVALIMSGISVTSGTIGQLSGSK